MGFSGKEYPRHLGSFVRTVTRRFPNNTMQQIQPMSILLPLQLGVSPSRNLF